MTVSHASSLTRARPTTAASLVGAGISATVVPPLHSIHRIAEFDRQIVERQAFAIIEQRFEHDVFTARDINRRALGQQSSRHQRPGHPAIAGTDVERSRHATR